MLNVLVVSVNSPWNPTRIVTQIYQSMFDIAGTIAAAAVSLSPSESALNSIRIAYNPTNVSVCANSVDESRSDFTPG
jgi:hypothetical protein